MKDSNALDLFSWIWDHILIPVGMAIGAVGKWLFDKRQSKATAANTELDAARKAREEWQLLFAEAKTTIHGMGEEMREMRSEMTVLRSEHEECNKTSALLTIKVETLQMQLDTIDKRKDTHAMITIERTYKDNCTVGKMIGTHAGKSIELATLELPWRNNERRVSCIPEGIYKAISHTSPKFGRTFWLQDVPGRSEILIHPGNFTRDLLGCIAPGMKHSDIDGDGITDVTQSRKAMDKLLTLLWGHSFDISITSQSGPPSVS